MEVRQTLRSEESYNADAANCSNPMKLTTEAPSSHFPPAPFRGSLDLEGRNRRSLDASLPLSSCLSSPLEFGSVITSAGSRVTEFRDDCSALPTASLTRTRSSNNSLEHVSGSRENTLATCSSRGSLHALNGIALSARLLAATGKEAFHDLPGPAASTSPPTPQPTRMGTSSGLQLPPLPEQGPDNVWVASAFSTPFLHGGQGGYMLLQAPAIVNGTASITRPSPFSPDYIGGGQQPAASQPLPIPRSLAPSPEALPSFLDHAGSLPLPVPIPPEVPPPLSNPRVLRHSSSLPTSRRLPPSCPAPLVFNHHPSSFSGSGAASFLPQPSSSPPATNLRLRFLLQTQSAQDLSTAGSNSNSNNSSSPQQQALLQQSPPAPVLLSGLELPDESVHGGRRRHSLASASGSGWPCVDWVEEASNCDMPHPSPGAAAGAAGAVSLLRASGSCCLIPGAGLGAGLGAAGRAVGVSVGTGAGARVPVLRTSRSCCISPAGAPTAYSVTTWSLSPPNGVRTLQAAAVPAAAATVAAAAVAAAAPQKWTAQAAVVTPAAAADGYTPAAAVQVVSGGAQQHVVPAQAEKEDAADLAGALASGAGGVARGRGGAPRVLRLLGCTADTVPYTGSSSSRDGLGPIATTMMAAALPDAAATQPTPTQDATVGASDTPARVPGQPHQDVLQAPSWVLMVVLLQRLAVACLRLPVAAVALVLVALPVRLLLGIRTGAGWAVGAASERFLCEGRSPAAAAAVQPGTSDVRSEPPQQQQLQTGQEQVMDEIGEGRRHHCRRLGGGGGDGQLLAALAAADAASERNSGAVEYR